MVEPRFGGIVTQLLVQETMFKQCLLVGDEINNNQIRSGAIRGGTSEPAYRRIYPELADAIEAWERGEGDEVLIQIGDPLELLRWAA